MIKIIIKLRLDSRGSAFSHNPAISPAMGAHHLSGLWFEYRLTMHIISLYVAYIDVDITEKANVS